jgi:DNA-binding HxlR family transcriptional regulator
MSTAERTVASLSEYEECPVTVLLATIGDRWSPAIIRALTDGPLGFNELDRRVPGLSRRMLTRTLRSLEAAGYLSRDLATRPGGRVEYSLTSVGLSLRDQLKLLSDWALEHAVASVPDAAD